jgi:hypothetical protein
VCVKPGVDAGGIGVEDGPGLVAERIEVALRGDSPAECPDEPVGVELALAKQLGQPTGRDVSPHLHLPHPLAGMDVALGDEQVPRGIGGDVRDARAVSYDRDRGAETRHPSRTARLRQRPCGEGDEQATSNNHGDNDRQQRQQQRGPDDAHDPSSRASRPRAPGHAWNRR